MPIDSQERALQGPAVGAHGIMDGTEPETGKHFDLIVADSPPKLFRDMELVGRDDDFYTFKFRNGRLIRLGRKFLIKLEEIVTAPDSTHWAEQEEARRQQRYGGER